MAVGAGAVWARRPDNRDRIASTRRPAGSSRRSRRRRASARSRPGAGGVWFLNWTDRHDRHGSIPRRTASPSGSRSRRAPARVSRSAAARSGSRRRTTACSGGSSPGGGRGQRPIDVGVASPTSSATATGAVWTGNYRDGVLARVDARTNAVTRTVRIEAPQALAVGAGSAWVSVAGATRAGTLPPAACTAVESGGATPDVLIASDLPLQGADADVPRGLADAIRWVLKDHGFRAGRHVVGYQSCDDSTAQTGDYEHGAAPRTPTPSRAPSAGRRGDRPVGLVLRRAPDPDPQPRARRPARAGQPDEHRPEPHARTADRASERGSAHSTLLPHGRAQHAAGHRPRRRRGSRAARCSRSACGSRASTCSTRASPTPRPHWPFRSAAWPPGSASGSPGRTPTSAPTRPVRRARRPRRPRPGRRGRHRRRRRGDGGPAGEGAACTPRVRGSRSWSATEYYVAATCSRARGARAHGVYLATTEALPDAGSLTPAGARFAARFGTAAHRGLGAERGRGGGGRPPGDRALGRDARLGPAALRSIQVTDGILGSFTFDRTATSLPATVTILRVTGATPRGVHVPEQHVGAVVDRVFRVPAGLGR